MSTSVRNPIYERELIYQRRTQFSRWVRHEARIVVVFVALVLLLVVWSFSARFGIGFIIALLFIWLFRFIASIRIIICGVAAIGREYQDGTWDTLLLTGMRERQIFFGKWSAVLKRVWGWSIALAVLWIVPLFAIYSESPYSLSDKSPVMAMVIYPLLCVVCAGLELISCSALGIAASILTQRTGAAIVLAGMIRVVPSLVGTLLFVTSLFGIDRYNYDSTFPEIMLGLAEPVSPVLAAAVSAGTDTYLIKGIVTGLILLLTILAVALLTALGTVHNPERQLR